MPTEIEVALGPNLHSLLPDILNKAGKFCCTFEASLERPFWLSEFDRRGTDSISVQVTLSGGTDSIDGRVTLSGSTDSIADQATLGSPDGSLALRYLTLSDFCKQNTFFIN